MTFAVPKGRIWDELASIMEKVGIIPEPAFFDKNERKLIFATNMDDMRIIRVRSFDVASFVAFGGAQFGVCGADVIEEFDFDGLYAPLNLQIGHCRLSVAEPVDLSHQDDPKSWSHIRIATKYPHLTRQHFAKRGVQSECIKLNGAMELAPMMGLCQRIVDLVSTGKTLQQNGLVEVEKIMDVSSKLIVHRASLKMQPERFNHWIERFRAMSVNER